MRRCPWPALLVTVLVAAGLALGVQAAVPTTSSAFTASVANSANKATAASPFRCSDTFASTTNASNAYFEYKFTGTSATAIDSSGQSNPGAFQGTGPHPIETGRPMACATDTGVGGNAYNPDGSTNWVSTSNSVGTSPANFSLAMWFKTTVAGGYLIGLAAVQTGTYAVYDRHVYLNTFGQLVFGTYNGGPNVVTSPSSYNDGLWHHMVATFSSSAGMALWVDGSKVASNATYTTAEADTGWWRIAYGNLSGWPNAPSSTYFSGSMRFAAAYKFVLSDDEIKAEYANGIPG